MPKRGLRWYKKASAKGNSTAMNNISVLYYDGEGVSQDRSEGIKWYKKAAVKGNKLAQIGEGW